MSVENMITATDILLTLLIVLYITILYILPKSKKDT